MNGGAQREFADATDVLQEPGADLGEGNAYMDDAEVTFTPQSVTCGLCQGVAALSRTGSIDAKGCRISGMCEFVWAKLYPEEYTPIDGGPTTSQLICGAEVGCSALITLQSNGEDNPIPTVGNGDCEIARRGDNWSARSAGAISRERLVAPDTGIAAFDGEGSGREE